MTADRHPTVSRSEVHRLLASPERRAILMHLHRAATSASIGPDAERGPYRTDLAALVDRLVAADVPAAVGVSPTDLRIRLHHVHLPMLDAVPGTGVSYDPAANRIEYVPTPLVQTAVELYGTRS